MAVIDFELMFSNGIWRWVFYFEGARSSPLLEKKGDDRVHESTESSADLCRGDGAAVGGENRSSQPALQNGLLPLVGRKDVT